MSAAGRDAARNRSPSLFRTARLVVRPAAEADAAFIVALWSDPEVMRHVGFPRGIPTARADVPRRIASGAGLSALLVAEDASTGALIGQCMLGTLDENGVCEPDIKLAPAQWGRGYGTELWSALVDRLFLTTDCATVRGTPNVNNAASIRMQEKAGMRRVGKGRSEFPESMRASTVPVTYWIYEIRRDEWADRRERDAWTDRRERDAWTDRRERDEGADRHDRRPPPEPGS